MRKNIEECIKAGTLSLDYDGYDGGDRGRRLISAEAYGYGLL